MILSPKPAAKISEILVPDVQNIALILCFKLCLSCFCLHKPLFLFEYQTDTILYDESWATRYLSVGYKRCYVNKSRCFQRWTSQYIECVKTCAGLETIKYVVLEVIIASYKYNEYIKVFLCISFLLVDRLNLHYLELIRS